MAGYLDRVRAHAVAIFWAAAGLAILHMVSDATLTRPDGSSVGAGLLSVAVPIGIAVAAGLLFSWGRPALQAWLAFVVGAVALADGGLHVAHARRAGAVSGDDVTGFLAGLAGLALVLLAIAIVVRPKGERSPLHRWSARLGVLVGAAATAFLLVIPLAVAVYLVHKQPVHVPSSALAVAHEDVTLHTSDGFELAAWYVPSASHTAVITVPGSGGDRRGGILSRTLMLARGGLGVLSYDPRGAGDSEGRPENLGWTWHRDVEAAVAFLERRGITRIGVLGLSTGAEVAIETAGRDPRIKAVVAEGAQARSFKETWELPSLGDKLTVLQSLGIPFAANPLLSRVGRPPPLKTQVAKIAPRPVFLISSGTSLERALDRVYFGAAGEPKTLWEMPNAQHTGGLSKHPVEYPARVLGFFRRWL